MTTMTDVKHATLATIGMKINAPDGDAESAVKAAELTAKLDEYFSVFADCDDKCPRCGSQLSGLLGNFRWGLAWGEGTCGCGWPCRGYHCPADDAGDIFDSPIQAVLPYHPDFVKSRDEETA